jgi:signal recognition particle GTPase
MIRLSRGPDDQAERQGFVGTAEPKQTTRQADVMAELKPCIRTFSTSSRVTSLHKGFTVWFTGLAGSGKTTVARLLEHRFLQLGCKVEVLDGDVVRIYPEIWVSPPQIVTRMSAESVSFAKCCH